MQKKDKEKVLDEVWTTERVKDFLNLTVPAGNNADFYVLHAAYKNMRIENFREFVDLFLANHRDITATNEKGQTVLDIIHTHKKSGEYAACLEAMTSG